MKNIIITGQPGAGKTLLIKRLSDIFKEFNPQGFLTIELKNDGVVTGLAVMNLAGESKILSHASLVKTKKGRARHSFDLKAFEAFIAATFTKERKTNLFFIDEIGKIECQSKKFCKLVSELLASDRLFIATMAEKGSSFIQDIKKRHDIRQITITAENRDLLLKELTMDIRDVLFE